MNRKKPFDDMGKEERKDLVLSFMAENQLALPPKVIFRNLRLHENITFSEKSVVNYLNEFVESELVARVDPASLEDREIIHVEENTNRKTYYIITDAGVERVSSE